MAVAVLCLNARITERTKDVNYKYDDLYTIVYRFTIDLAPRGDLLTIQSRFS